MSDYLKTTGHSFVWIEDGWVYKQQHKFMTDNELYFIELLAPTGYVLPYERLDTTTFRTRHIQNKPITSVAKFASHITPIFTMLGKYGVRHGDLTEYAILVENNHPYIIDWAESRLLGDPRPDKRPEGDTFWLRKTFERIINGKSDLHPPHKRP